LAVERSASTGRDRPAEQRLRQLELSAGWRPLRAGRSRAAASGPGLPARS